MSRHTSCSSRLIWLISIETGHVTSHFVLFKAYVTYQYRNWSCHVTLRALQGLSPSFRRWIGKMSAININYSISKSLLTNKFTINITMSVVWWNSCIQLLMELSSLPLRFILHCAKLMLLQYWIIMIICISSCIEDTDSTVMCSTSLSFHLFPSNMKARQNFKWQHRYAQQFPNNMGTKLIQTNNSIVAN
jgi:hypothetical protein